MKPGTQGREYRLLSLTEKGMSWGVVCHFDEELVYFTKMALWFALYSSPAPHQPYTINHDEIIDICSLDEGVYGNSLWGKTLSPMKQSCEDGVDFDRNDEMDEYERGKRRKSLRSMPLVEATKPQ